MARKRKVCSRCEADLVAATNYNKDKRTVDGYRYECKLCQYKTQFKHLGKKIKEMEGKKDGRTRSED